METDDSTVGGVARVEVVRDVAAAVDELAVLHLVGRDPRAIEDIWTVLYRAASTAAGRST